MKLLETPMPVGYDAHALFLRTWLLGIRLRVEATPLERQKSLAKVVRELAPDRGKRKRKRDAKILARIVRP